MASTTFETDRTTGVRQVATRFLPYLLLSISVIPILIGYAWVIIATFSERTQGLKPVDAQGNFGGFTLQNWNFILDLEIWRVTLNTFLVAAFMVAGVVTVSSLTAYALSRMNFAGRKGFLSMTLILHAFRPEMLLVAIFMVLLVVAKIPLLGDLIGFNTVGGVAIVLISLELPLGVWLMKGFFDNISWDMERAALIDGASRFRVWWQIIIPQIKPGIAALSVFSFITGWNAYLIPQTFTVGAAAATLPTYLNQFSQDTGLASWSEVAALGLFSLIPVVLFFVFTQEALLNIYAGGSKGS